MELNNDNYFSQESNQYYMSCSQFKDFLKCEKETLAKINGELVEEKTDALLFGGYVDAYFSNELDQFKLANPEMFNTKTGELKAPFKRIDEVISAIESDTMLMKYLNGEKQVIMTGEIAGVPFKIKIDAYHPDTKETIEFEGETYPLVKLEISNTSHPFYTGKSKLVDTAGRVDKFMSRYGNRLKK